MSELVFRTACELARLIRDREASAYIAGIDFKETGGEYEN
jgi:hypothetical protein